MADELRYWSTLARDAPAVLGPGGGEVQKRAQAMQRLLEPVAGRFEKIKTLDIGEDSGLIGDTVKTLNDIAETGGLLTGKRTLHLIHLVTQGLVGRVQHEFAGADLWTKNFSDVRARLNEWIKRVCRHWLDQIGDWKRQNALSGKKGDTSTLALETLMTRLSNVYRMRAKYDELLRLLPGEVQEQVQLEQVLEPLKGAPAVVVNEFARKQWERAES